MTKKPPVGAVRIANIRNYIALPLRGVWARRSSDESGSVTVSIAFRTASSRRVTGCSGDRASSSTSRVTWCTGRPSEPGMPGLVGRAKPFQEALLSRPPWVRNASRTGWFSSDTG